MIGLDDAGAPEPAIVSEGVWADRIDLDSALDRLPRRHLLTLTPEVVFADSLVGYATVRGGISRTVDGGLHWTDVHTPGT